MCESRYLSAQAVKSVMTFTFVRRCIEPLKELEENAELIFAPSQEEMKTMCP